MDWSVTVFSSVNIPYTSEESWTLKKCAQLVRELLVEMGSKSDSADLDVSLI